jgi:transposase-like protein
MKQDDFDQLAGAIDSLSPSQRHQFLESLQDPETIPAIIEQLEQHLQSHLQCPKCNHDQIHRWGTFKDRQRYRCRGCHKTFTALTGTPLASLNKHELWMEYAQSMLDAESLRKAAARCHIHLATAFLWRHRFLELAKHLNSDEFTGSAEAD